MKKGFKQSLAVILSAVLLLTMLPFTASAAAATEDSVGATSGTTGDCTWTLEDGVLTISGNGAMGDYNYYYDSRAPWKNSEFSQAVIENGVTNIGKYAFYYCSSLSTVTIPDSVISIDDFAFGLCQSLNSITIPDSVMSIGDNAFSSCRKLKSVTIPPSVTSIDSSAFSICSSLSNIIVDSENPAYSSINGNLYNKDATTLIMYAIGKADISFTIPNFVTRIGDYTFSYCKNLTSVTIPNSVTSIGSYAFYNCNNLRLITIPDSVTRIGSFAFDSCSSLTSVNIPNSVTSIYIYTFANCSSLTSVTIPDSVTRISNFAFNGCSRLTSITIPPSVTSIGDSAFLFCNNLTSVTLPNTLTNIESNAFYHCISLTSITIPASVISIGDHAFSSCNRLLNIIVDGANKTYSSINGNLYNKDGNTLIQYACGKTDTSFTIPDSVTNIRDSAFFFCTNLTKVNIPKYVTTIGHRAFGYYYKDNSYQKIDGFTITGYRGSAAEAYANDNEFNFIAIEDSFAFQYQLLADGTAEITKYTGNGGAIAIPSKLDGYTVTSISYRAFMNCSSLTSVTIPDSVTSIDYGVFYGCSSLASVNIPDSVTSIGDIAFSGCSSLTAVTIPDSVTSIGSSAFSDCSSLSSMNIPDSVTSIGSSAFSGCSSLSSMNIPDSVTSIGDYAFYGCSSLTSVNIPNSVTSIGDYAFFGCSSLASVTIPQSVTRINFRALGYNGNGKIDNFTITGYKGSAAEAYAYNHQFTFIAIEDSSAFFQYQTLSDGTAEITKYTGNGGDIIIPSELDGHTVTSIGNEAFSNCSSLTSVIIPTPVTTIGNKAFGYKGNDKINNFTITGYKGSAAETYANENGFTFVALDDNLELGDVNTDGYITVDDARIISEYLADLEKLTDRQLELAEFDGDGKITISDATYIQRYIIGVEDPYHFQYRYQLHDDGTAEITGYSGKAVTIWIPSSIEGHTVTRISEAAFLNCKSLLYVKIPNSVTNIGEKALGYNKENNEYKKIDIFTIQGDKNSAAETYANENGFTFSTGFSYQMIYSYNDDDNSQIICYEITRNKGKNSEIIIPSSIYGHEIISIDNKAFSGCNNLISVSIPDSVTRIGEGAFEDCSNLTSVTIPNSVTRIGTHAFGYSGDEKIDNFTITGYRGSAAEAYAKDNQFTFIATEDSSAFQYRIFFDGTADITKYTGNGGAIAIPSKLDGHTVTCIDSLAFFNCSSLTSVSIPDSVTSIGDEAFDGCSNLSSVNIPDSVTNIGMAAFFDCSSLTSVTIPNSVTSIGDYAFRGCSSLTSVSIPDSVTNIGWAAFVSCSSLSSVSIPDSVTRINLATFNGCSSLSSVSIPDSVTHIGGSAFANCSSLTDVTIPNSVTRIDSFAFDGCSRLTSVTIPNTVTTIGNKAFGYNGDDKIDNFTITGYRESAAETYAKDNGFNFVMLKEYPDFNYRILDNDTAEIIGYTGNGGAVSIPSTVDGYSVTSIGESAFYNVKKLTSVTIPNTVTSIGRSSFSGCSSLTAVTIPNSVTSISHLAFYGCTGLTSVTIPDSVTSVGNWAFNDCDNLKAVTIPDSVNTIGYQAFGYLSNGKVNNFTITGKTGSAAETYAKTNCFIFNDPSAFKYRILDDGTAEITGYTGNGGDIIIPSELDGHAVTSIGNKTFSNCSSLASVSIPDSVTSIGKDAFSDCSSLSSIQVDTNNTAFCSIDGNLYNKDATTLIQYATGKTADSFSIPNSVKVIGDSAFRKCTSLTTVSIPDSVTSIGKDAFSDCNSLSSIQVDTNNTAFCSIDGNLYNKDATTLIQYATGKTAKSFSIPNSVKVIGDSAFRKCTNLTTVSIPNSVTNIGYKAFSGCSNLTDVTIPNSVQTIDSNAFYGCSKLTDFIIPDSVTSVGDYAFKNCSNLTSVIIFNSVTTIGKMAFGYNDSNKKIENFTIVGYKNSTSETYAKNINFKFYEIKSADDYLYTETENGTANIIRYTGNSSEVTIPSILNNHTVKNIEKYAFGYYQSSNGKMTRIGNFTAFVDRGSAAEKYAYDNGITFVATEDSSAFDYTMNDNTVQITKYKGKGGKIIIPSSINGHDVKSIGNNAFENCSNLVTVTIPDTVSSIGDNAFSYCNNLTYITIPDSVSSIGELAFNGCMSLFTITIPNSVTSIGQQAFGYLGNTKIEGSTIVGTNSTAESYAYDNGFTFISADDLANNNNDQTYPFVWGQDNWNFSNNSSIFTNNENQNLYGIYCDVFKKIIEKLNLPTQVSKYIDPDDNKIMDKVLDKVNKKWGGSCFGMTITAMLVKQGLMDLNDYQCDPAIHNNNPVTNKYVIALINAFQLLQNAYDITDITETNNNNIINNYRKAYKTGKNNNSSNKDLIKKLETVLEDNNADKKTLVFIGYQFIMNKNPQVHAVLAYGIEDDNYKYEKTGIEYNKKILICDPTHSGMNGVFDRACIYYYYNEENKDDPKNYSWIIPVKCNSNNNTTCYWNSDSDSTSDSTGNILTMMTVGKDEKSGRITFSNLIEPDNSANSNGSSSSSSDNTHNNYPYAMIGSPNNINARLEIESDHEYTISGYDKIVQYYPETDEDIDFYELQSSYENSCNISFPNASTANIYMEYEDIAYYLDASNVKSVIYQPNGYISMNGEGSTYSMKLVTNDCECVTKDWHALTVKGSNANQVTLELDKERKGYILSSSSGLGTITLKANNFNISASRTLNTDAKKILIDEKNEHTIGVKIDADNNGTYETELPIDENSVGLSINADSSGTNGTELITNTFAIGDVTGDGFVNVRDITAIQRYLAELVTLSNDQLASADVNGDDIVDINDVTHLKRYLAEFDDVILGKQNQ